MLILTAKPRDEEPIYVFDRNTDEPVISVKVIESRGNQVKLGFQAHHSKKIMRGSLLSPEELERYDIALGG